MIRKTLAAALSTMGATALIAALLAVAAKIFDVAPTLQDKGAQLFMLACVCMILHFLVSIDTGGLDLE